jgi:hypothetical protein
LESVLSAESLTTGTSLSDGADSSGSIPLEEAEEAKKKKDDPDIIISKERQGL